VQSTADDGSFPTIKPSYIYQLCQTSSNPRPFFPSRCMATVRGLTRCRRGEGSREDLPKQEGGMDMAGNGRSLRNEEFPEMEGTLYPSDAPRVVLLRVYDPTVLRKKLLEQKNNTSLRLSEAYITIIVTC